MAERDTHNVLMIGSTPSRPTKKPIFSIDTGTYFGNGSEVKTIEQKRLEWFCRANGKEGNPLEVKTKLCEVIFVIDGEAFVYYGAIPYQGLKRFAHQSLLNRILRSLSLRWLLFLEKIMTKHPHEKSAS